MLVNERHLRSRLRSMIRMTLHSVRPSLWICGVLNDVFVSGLPGLVDQSGHVPCSFQYTRVLVSRSHASVR